jgi:hypothetical protein
MAVAKLDVIEQYDDNSGNPLNGGLLYTYSGGTSTPLALFTDSTGLIQHSNPIVLDSSGRPPGDGLWFTTGVAVKVVVKTSAGVTLDTIDNVVAPDTSTTASGGIFILPFLYHGTSPPTATEWLGGESITDAASFPANFTGAFGHINTNPTSSFVITLRKNATTSATGTAIGTVTIATNGTFTFATTAGAVISVAAGITSPRGLRARPTQPPMISTSPCAGLWHDHCLCRR